VVVDLIGSCRAFVGVSETGSFTAGAAAAHIPQPVASRRIAALERHLGERLFDRSTRRAQLTPFGRDMLPSAKRLVQLADAMAHDATLAKLRPLLLAVPDTCTTRALAELDAEARAVDVHLEFRRAAPADRAELVRTHEVRAAILAVPAEEGTWTVPLGVAAGFLPDASVLHLETLRAGRSGRAPRRVWIQPEDDVPHIRDRLIRVRDSIGLQPSQVGVAGSLTSAAATVFGSADLLLCSVEQADELGLGWRPIGEIGLARGVDIAAVLGDDADRLRTRLRSGIASCLGIPAAKEAPCTPKR
jgi:DNA-binding transcriptional LysR family regulator